jgi:hypothetical protein
VATFTKVSGPTINETVKEPCIGSAATKNMKEIGKTTSKVASVLISGLMAPLTTSSLGIDMSVTGNWARDTEKVPSTIQMAANTRETGKKTSNMVQESSLSRMAHSTMAHLKTTEWSIGRCQSKMLR